MEFTQIKETCLYVAELDRTREFYHKKLGLEVISHVSGRHVFFRAGSSVLLCFLPEATKSETRLPPHFSYGKQHLAFEIPADRYNQVRKALESSGIPITHTQHWKGTLFSCYFEDPDGHVLEIVPHGIWE